MNLSKTLNLLKGLGVTLKYFFKPTVTLIYPKEKPDIPQGSRGILKMSYNRENKRLVCVNCKICVNICPVSAIKIETHPDGKVKRYIFDHEKCIYCGLCTENCPYQGIYWDKNFELADLKRNNQTIYEEFIK